LIAQKARLYYLPDQLNKLNQQNKTILRNSATPLYIKEVKVYTAPYSIWQF
jgi:hypothetical protein